MESEKDAILGENRSLAENNLEKEPKLIELRARVCEMAEEGQNLCKSIQEKLTQISKIFDCFFHDNLNGNNSFSYLCRRKLWVGK